MVPPTTGKLQRRGRLIIARGFTAENACLIGFPIERKIYSVIAYHLREG